MAESDGALAAARRRWSGEARQWLVEEAAKRDGDEETVVDLLSTEVTGENSW